MFSRLSNATATLPLFHAQSNSVNISSTNLTNNVGKTSDTPYENSIHAMCNNKDQRGSVSQQSIIMPSNGKQSPASNIVKRRKSFLLEDHHQSRYVSLMFSRFFSNSVLVILNRSRKIKCNYGVKFL